MIWLIVLWGIWAAAFVLAFVFGRRINAVHDYRMKLLDLIHEAASSDIRQGVADYEWRLDAYCSVEFGTMVLMFWKPLDSFYPDKSFIRKLPELSGTREVS